MSIELSCCRTYRPPEPPCTPGISPTPSQPCITCITQNQVLSQSTSSRSCANNAQNNLVAATLLKLSRTFSPNITKVLNALVFLFNRLKNMHTQGELPMLCQCKCCMSLFRSLLPLLLTHVVETSTMLVPASLFEGHTRCGMAWWLLHLPLI